MQARHIKTLWGIGVLAGVAWACETTRNPGGVQRDLTPPSFQLTNAAGDTQEIAGGLRFTINAADNLGLKSIDLAFSGGHIATDDTVFTSAVTKYDVTRTVTFPGGSGAGGLVQIVGIATDGAGNIAQDTLFIFLSNVSALRVQLLSPAALAVASYNLGIPVEVIAQQREGIRKIGFVVTPPNFVSNPTVPPQDSILYAVPYLDSVGYVDTLIVTQQTGQFTVVGFAEDSTGRRGSTSPVTVTIQSALNDTTPPFVEHTITGRVEVSDSVIVHATDASGISWIGLRITDPNGVLIRFDSVNVAAGSLTDVTRKMSLNLASYVPPGGFPYSVVVRGYACDLAVARNCALAQNSTLIAGSAGLLGGGPQRAPGADTVVVVAGVTRPFPLAGTRIADAIFDANRNELYLTNPPLSRVEVFQVANTTFVAAGIPTAGPQPWGVALWPRDTLGNYADTIVVANSGGTQLAIINVGPGGPRQLLWRQDLPDFLIQTYKVVQNGSGSYQVQIIEYNVSDRPQYVGTVCRAGAGTACHADSVFAIYSTTPTVSSDPPFSGRATLRMEKLTSSTNPVNLYSHLFWEIATEGPSLTNDTLRIVMRRPLPYNEYRVSLSACAGQNVDLSKIGLGDSTFVRNSGNFTHALVGEGGTVTTQFARAIAYSAKLPIIRRDDPFPCPTAPDTSGLGNAPSDSGSYEVDLGISPGVEVKDFISNTGINVSSVATNFNGATNVVRADSIYYLDEGLRLKATSPAPQNAPGMDMNYNHAFAPSGACPPLSTACGGSGSPNDRILFAARPDAGIDVYDTYFGARIGAVPVRDPIIGPLRVARDATGQLLFGVTARGLVVLRLPAFVNPNPAPGR